MRACQMLACVHACVYAYAYACIRAYRCGAAIAPLMTERYRSLFGVHESIVVVVCGGSGVNWSIMEQWRKEYASD